MLPFEDRYTRQRQLDEVGAEGQERLLRLEVHVARGASGDVTATYLERSGARVTRGSLSRGRSGDTPFSGCGVTFRHATAFRHAAARSFAEGAHRALCAIRRELGLERDPKPPPGGRP